MALLWLCMGAAAADGPQRPAEETSARTGSNFVEAGGNYYGLSSGFGDWAGAYFRGVLTRGANVWNWETVGEHEFHADGVYFAGGNTHTFNEDWYGSLTLGTSAGGFFYPRFRADGFLNRKLLHRRQLVASFGLGYYQAKDVHHDTSVSLGGVYYFNAPWIVEGGLRWNISSPGSVFSQSQFAAVTQGREKRHYLTLRSGWGREAYQLIGPRAILSDFRSQEASVTWRQWVRGKWGFNLVGDYYRNPSYHRAGASFGVFRDF